jgi:IS605 OrfB family transposase
MLNGKIKIVITVDDNSSSQVYTKNVIEGVDVNVKHNLFQLSNGHSIDYDRKLLKKIFKQQKKIDEIKSHKDSLNLDKNFGTRLLLKNQKNKNRVTNMLERKIVELLKYCKKHNIDHLVFEKLGQFNGKNYSNNKEFDVNYNRLIRALHLSDIKNMVLRIGKKYGITISLINPKYTSQQCNVCGYISSYNRQNQEHFHCRHCGHEENADLNAAKNIKQRIQSNVLRELLHEEINTNQYEMISDEKEYSFKESLLLATYLDNY